ncbi:helix-turn-helix transcriptional regulator [Filibacter tadaridae]|uniref:Helix-turn-helix protein n=1 Tax=Filibacter tadaridae TaxID=2483811 RepID=A0A3P5WJ56_9BACL|nr:helix-turn-helix transcriptional regulator [Filibacter tadaridae]VDC19449.1 helix-turn-helix protein [Filibacter tadaridae]
MIFGTQFKEFREEHLKIRQFEAARALNITPAALSNYERNERDITSEFLLSIKKTFNIPDDYFLAMIIGTPLKSVGNPKVGQPFKTQEARARYMDHFVDQHRQLFEENAELRELVVFVNTLTEKDRRNFLNSIKSILTLFQNFTEKQEKE